MRAALALAFLSAGCGMKFDPKTATFYKPSWNHAPIPGPAPARAAVHCDSWRTIEPDGAAFLGVVQARARAARIWTSRMNDSLELSRGATRLRMTPMSSEILYDCCAASQESCRSLLQAVLNEDDSS